MGSRHVDAADNAGVERRLRNILIAVLLGGAGYVVVNAASFLQTAGNALVDAASSPGALSGLLQGLGNALLDLAFIVQAGFLWLLGIPALIGLYVYAFDQDWSFIDVSLPRLRDFGYIIAGLLAIILLLLLLSQVFQAVGANPSEHGIEQQAQQNPELLLYMIPIAILLIGPYEELIYRNLVQKHLYRVFSKRNAVLVASVIFALFHYQAYATGAVSSIALSLVMVFALSTVLGAVYAKTENIVVPAIVHGFYNAIAFSVMYLNITGGV